MKLKIIVLVEVILVLFFMAIWLRSYFVVDLLNTSGATRIDMGSMRGHFICGLLINHPENVNASWSTMILPHMKLSWYLSVPGLKDFLRSLVEFDGNIAPSEVGFGCPYWVLILPFTIHLFWIQRRGRKQRAETRLGQKTPDHTENLSPDPKTGKT